MKALAWKTNPASGIKCYQNISSRNRIKDFPPQNASRCEPVNGGVCRRFQRDLTQFLHNLRADLSRCRARGAGSARLDGWHSPSHTTSMALARKKATTIALGPEDDRLLTRAARARGVSRSEFIRQHLTLVLEQYRRHPKPRSAGIVRALTQQGDERELFSAGG